MNIDLDITIFYRHEPIRGPTSTRTPDLIIDDLDNGIVTISPWLVGKFELYGIEFAWRRVPPVEMQYLATKIGNRPHV